MSVTTEVTILMKTQSLHGIPTTVSHTRVVRGKERKKSKRPRYKIVVKMRTISNLVNTTNTKPKNGNNQSNNNIALWNILVGNDDKMTSSWCNKMCLLLKSQKMCDI